MVNARPFEIGDEVQYAGNLYNVATVLNLPNGDTQLNLSSQQVGINDKFVVDARDVIFRASVRRPKEVEDMNETERMVSEPVPRFTEEQLVLHKPTARQASVIEVVDEKVLVAYIGEAGEFWVMADDLVETNIVSPDHMTTVQKLEVVHSYFQDILKQIQDDYHCKDGPNIVASVSFYRYSDFDVVELNHTVAFDGRASQTSDSLYTSYERAKRDYEQRSTAKPRKL